MSWDQVKGNWKQVRGEALSRWGKITGDELDEAHGERDQLVGLIQEKYGMAKTKAKEQVDEFETECEGYLAKAKQAISDTAQSVKQKAGEANEYFRNTDMSEMMEDVRGIIARYPTQSLLVGLGVGFLIGRGLGGRQ